MALSIHPSVLTTDGFSSTGGANPANPLQISFDGFKGGSKTFQLFLQNNGATSFTGISISSVTLSGKLITDGSLAGYSWKLILSSLEPAATLWDSVIAGNSLVMADMLSTDGPQSFWLKVEVPISKVESFTESTLRISFTEVI